MEKFKILSHKMYDFYTYYKIKYNNKIYECNYNGGLPKLKNKRLNENQRTQLSDIIEDYFLSIQTN